MPSKIDTFIKGSRLGDLLHPNKGSDIVEKSQIVPVRVPLRAGYRFGNKPSLRTIADVSVQHPD